jgi:metallo-beta-lactamase family protein
MNLTFYGAAKEVTGSCYLIECGGARVLVDCGLIQGNRAAEAHNREAFPFNPAEINAVVLTHAHLDHSGRLPLLVTQGFRGKIYAHRATRDLCRIMLKDAANINEKDTEHENRRRARKRLPPLAPLFTVSDALRAIKNFRAMSYGEEFKIAPGVLITLHDAGHILGSSIVSLKLEENGETRRVVMSGDLGHAGAPILHDPTAVRQADLVVLESTYGDRRHRSWDSTWAELKNVFANIEAARGNILIPAFAIGRAQELLYLFRQHENDWGLKRWTVFLDSPMAIEATRVYAHHAKLYDEAASAQHRMNGDAFAAPNLHLTHTPMQSMAINRFTTGAIIIAGSGMCDGGRIRHHLKHNLWRESCHVLFVGYQAQGTLGRKLVDGADRVRLFGETVRVAAKIHTVGGLSAHADQQGLIDWMRHFENRPAVALVHGEEMAMPPLAARLQSELGCQVFVPEARQTLDLLQLSIR